MEIDQLQIKEETNHKHVLISLALNLVQKKFESNKFSLNRINTVFHEQFQNCEVYLQHSYIKLPRKKGVTGYFNMNDQLDVMTENNTKICYRYF